MTRRNHVFGPPGLPRRARERVRQRSAPLVLSGPTHTALTDAPGSLAVSIAVSPRVRLPARRHSFTLEHP
jgi:hypothetical protein